MEGGAPPSQLPTEIYACKESEKTIAAALTENYRDEHVFTLKQAVELWDFYQGRIRECDTRIEKAKAVIATARKMAVLFYSIMKHGKKYVEPGAEYYETQYRNRVLANLKKRAKRLGYELVANAVPETLYAEVSQEMFENDQNTDAVVIIGEIGGQTEEQAAGYFKEYMNKPVTAFIAGVTAPPGRRMGHAGAIVSGGVGDAVTKIRTLEEAGITVVKSPALIGETLAAALKA